MAELRHRLEREGERIDLAPDVLERVYRGRRRRELRRRLVAGLTAAALTIGVAGWLGAGLLGESGDRPLGRPSAVPVAGTYRMTLTEADPNVAELGLAGTYVLRLSADGVIQLSTPPGFEETYESASGDAYRVTGNVIRIGSFTSFSCPGTVGTYRVDRTASELRLTPIDEPCVLRSTIFGTLAWTVV